MNNSNRFFSLGNHINYLGNGEVGGKAKGLELIQELLNGESFHNDSLFEVDIPKTLLVRTSVFDDFMSQNDLYEIALSDESDEHIALAFQKASLPFNILADLRYLVKEIKVPLVIRSSSLLEDAKAEPFAGVFGTKMTPNNQVELDVRFRKLIEAIKFVYASTFFKNAKDYFRATNYDIRTEKMGLVIQEVIGSKYGKRFYPEFSGVLKSYNYYNSDDTRPEDGVVNFAIGLGKEIVDGGRSWPFSPSAPLKNPPFKSNDDLLKNTQLRFFSVNVGEPPPYNPTKEGEFLLYNHINTALPDETLSYLVSTDNIQSNRIWDGPKGQGAKVANFKPLLKNEELQINELLKKLMTISEQLYDNPVEIEFAVDFAKNNAKKHRFGFLQVRPMNVSNEVVSVNDEDKNNAILYSEVVLGNGNGSEIRDFVYVKQSDFKPETTRKLTREIEELNSLMLEEQKQYVLFGYGRWGTTDEWAGIPVDWSQISAAKVIVEAASEGMNQQMSQASHFFHNVSSFKVFYFSLPLGSASVKFDKKRIKSLQVVSETEYIIHYRTQHPFEIKVDGRTGKGVINM